MTQQSPYRDPQAVRNGIAEILKAASRPWKIMEVCGGQTHALLEFGFDELLAEKITLLHGPGCPVCVTPANKIEKAMAIAEMPDVIFTSFGDMLRVPAGGRDLLSVKAGGADIRILYSPLDVLELARKNPNKQVVFFAVGFETTAPTIAMTVYRAAEGDIPNLSFLVSHVRVPPAIELLLSSPGNEINGFLAAGHVCTVMGYHEYIPIAQKHHTPIVVTGFEPMDLLHGIALCVRQLETGTAHVENPYERSVSLKGNVPAQNMIRKIFRTCDREWRGIGTIPNSGLDLRDEYRQFDAEYRFDVKAIRQPEPEACQSGQVLQGMIKPDQCPAFGTDCTPEHPMGATMVSSEGACAAYYRYHNRTASN